MVAPSSLTEEHGTCLRALRRVPGCWFGWGTTKRSDSAILILPSPRLYWCLFRICAGRVPFASCCSIRKRPRTGTTIQCCPIVHLSLESENDSRHLCFFLNLGRLFCPLKERFQASPRRAEAPSITHFVTSSVQGYSVSRSAWKCF